MKDIHPDEAARAPADQRNAEQDGFRDPEFALSGKILIKAHEREPDDVRDHKGQDEREFRAH